MPRLVLHRVSLTLLAMLAARAASPHHSTAEYDFDRTIEVEGTLVEVKWQNPHVHFKVRAGAVAGAAPVVWEIEGSSLSVMRRTNATPDKLHVGERVKVAGNPSRRAPNRLDALNLLIGNETELVLAPGVQPRWKSVAKGSNSTWFDGGTAEQASAGIFRVWSTKLDEGGAFWLEKYPLTEVGAKKRAAWNPLEDTVTHGCEPKGMPTIMEQPYPLEFVRRGNAILLRMEEYDTVRTIEMTDAGARPKSAAPQSRPVPKSRLGRSIGHWEGATLVVHTDALNWPFIDPEGTPLSPDASLLERFTPSADGTHLLYTLVIADPQFLRQPVELKRSWVARPNEAVKPYDCRKS